MSAAPYTVRMHDGRALPAVDVEYIPGWLRVETVAIELDVDEEARTARSRAAGRRVRTFPADAVREVEHNRQGGAA